MNTLEDKLKGAVLAAALEEEKASRRRTLGRVLAWAVPAVAAACVALIVALPSPRPKDTFDDPQLAYAELERTFAMIAQKIDKGAELAIKAEPPIETIKTIYK